MSQLYQQRLVNNKVISIPVKDLIEANAIKNPPPIIGIQRGIVWSVDDYYKLEEYMRTIRLYKWMGDTLSAFRLTAYLNIFIRRTFNDHRPQLLYKTKVEGIDALVGENKITASGIIGIVNALANQSVRFYHYMSMGRSRTPETIGQDKLVDEEVRLSVLKDGSMAARGNSWNHVGNFGYGVQSDRYYEFGIHDSDKQDALMLSRSVLTNGLKQTQNETFLTVSHSTIFTPK